MGVLLILACTLIGYLVGSPVLGLAVGLVIVFFPWAVGEWEDARAARRRARRYRR